MFFFSLSGGSTWHSGGLVTKLRATFAETMLCDYSAKLYNTIESEAGVSAGEVMLEFFFINLQSQSSWSGHGLIKKNNK